MSDLLFRLRTCLAGLLVFLPLGARAHPHVFVDGGVDFVMGAENELTALAVTWRYDAFETLYILASHGLDLNADGGLDPADRERLIRERRDFPADFDGSAHLTVDGHSIALAWPSDFDARIVDQRLEVTFSRALDAPLDITVGEVTLAFYESTYFFAFSLTEKPQFIGPASCRAEIEKFVADEDDTVLMATLAKLDREDTSDMVNVGALFADRISLSCA